MESCGWTVTERHVVGGVRTTAQDPLRKRSIRFGRSLRRAIPPSRNTNDQLRSPLRRDRPRCHSRSRDLPRPDQFPQGETDRRKHDGEENPVKTHASIIHGAISEWLYVAPTDRHSPEFRHQTVTPAPGDQDRRPRGPSYVPPSFRRTGRGERAHQARRSRSLSSQSLLADAGSRVCDMASDGIWSAVSGFGSSSRGAMSLSLR